jgi:uncharacterized protein (DUF1778 family)
MMDTQVNKTGKQKGIPYKPIENKATANILLRLTESQKDVIRNKATRNNQTVSEYIRTLAIKATSKK